MFIHDLPHSFYRVQVWAIRREIMEPDIDHLCPVLHQLREVVACPIQNDMNCLIVVRVNFSYLIEKTGYFIFIDCLVFTNQWVCRSLQVQRSHDIQTGTAARGFYRFSVAFAYPAIADFGGLSRVNSINKKNRFVACGFF